MGDLRRGGPVAPIRLWNGSGAGPATGYDGVRSILADGRFSNIPATPGYPAIAESRAASHAARGYAGGRRPGVRAGAVGEMVCGLSNYYAGAIERPEWPNASPQEKRLRNWIFDKTISGDIIVEQNIHLIDVNNWVLGAHPVSAQGSCGRKGRLRPKADPGLCPARGGAARGPRFLPPLHPRLARHHRQRAWRENPVSYTHLRYHETVLDTVCRLLLEKKKTNHTPKTH